MRHTILLDTNLLVLLIVGRVSKALIARHKKLTAFIAEDYDALLRILSNASSVIVTPHILTETSNLAAYIGEPDKTRVFEELKKLIAQFEEIHIPSQKVANRPEFHRLGLTDTALVEASSEKVVILTTDLSLYREAISQGKSAWNFNHVREQYLYAAEH